MDRIDSIIGVDHIGYAVKDMDAAKEYFRILGYTFTEDTVDEYRKVNVSVGKMGECRIVLLAPLEGVKFPVDGYLTILNFQ